MSATRARQRRAQRAGIEWALQAHDALHKDDVDACHHALHVACGLEDDAELLVAPLAPHSAFDREFVELCKRYRVSACYVAEGEVTARGTRLLSGGSASLCAWLDGQIGDAP